MIGYNVTEMIAEIIRKKIRNYRNEILKAIYLHPTMSEAIMESC